MNTITVDTQHSAGYWGPMLGVYGRDEVFHAEPVTILTADELTISVRDGRAYYRIADGAETEVTCDQPASAITHDEIVAYWQATIVRLANLHREIVSATPNPEPPAAAALPEVDIVNIPVTAGANDTILVGGYTLRAPGFTAEQFDRAIRRAFTDGLRLAPTDRPDMVLVTNPRNGASYTVSRTSCSCKAGQAHTPCKHIAFAILSADVWNTLPTPAGRAA